MKSKCIYDLSAEEQLYDPEDLDVFTLVWNNHDDDTLADKLIVEADDQSLYLIDKPSKAEELIGNAMSVAHIVTAISLTATLVLLSVLAALTLVSTPGIVGTISVVVIVAIVGLIDFYYGGSQHVRN